MTTRQTTRVLRLAASTVLAAAVGPVLAQDAATKPTQGRATTPGGYLTTLSIFKQEAPKPPAPASDASKAHPETLPPPRAVADSTTSGTALSSPQPSSWWQRCKFRFWSSLGYEAEFEPAPFGTSVYTAYLTHVVNGDAARMVLYDYDFVGHTAALNTHGQDQVAKIASMLPRNGFPVIVERTPSNPELAEARRLAVLTQLGRGGVTVPPERVVIGAPIANGLRGAEAEIIYQNLLTQTRERGLVTGAASGFVGAATSPGTGGGAGAGTGGGSGSPPPQR
jgi:hypothetical protein